MITSLYKTRELLFLGDDISCLLLGFHFPMFAVVMSGYTYFSEMLEQVIYFFAVDFDQRIVLSMKSHTKPCVIEYRLVVSKCHNSRTNDDLLLYLTTCENILYQYIIPNYRILS